MKKPVCSAMSGALTPQRRQHQAAAMWRRGGAPAAGGLLALALALVLSVGPEAVAGVSVAQACREVSCFSGVVAACGSCLPAQADAVSGRVGHVFSREACTEVGGAGPRLSVQPALAARDRAEQVVSRIIRAV